MGGSASTEKRKDSEEFVEEEIEENEHCVEIGDQNAVKNMLDDTITEYFQDRKDYVLHYGWDNAKLLLMVFATIVAATSHFYRSPMITERVLIYTCVIGFFAIHAILLAHTVFVERDVIVRMSKSTKNASAVMVKTNFPFTEENYSVEFQSATTASHHVKADFYVGQYFDAEGYFDRDAFVKHLETLTTRFEKKKAQ